MQFVDKLTSIKDQIDNNMKIISDKESRRFVKLETADILDYLDVVKENQLILMDAVATIFETMIISDTEPKI